MDKDKNLELLESSTVQAHVSMLQGIINRMGANSANCKNWTVTITAGILAFLVEKDMPISNAWICLIPIGLFYLLDCYYLGLERLCISSQEKFLEKIHNKEDYTQELYKIGELKDSCRQFCSILKATRSISTTPFYLLIVVAVLAFGYINGCQ